MMTLARTTALALGLTFATPLMAHPHPHKPKPSAITNQVALAGPVISGSRAFRYQYVPEKLVLPPERKDAPRPRPVPRYRGPHLFHLRAGKSRADTRVLVRFEPDGTGASCSGRTTPWPTARRTA